MDKKEIWLPVKGYEGLYEVSSFGRVRSLNYMHTGKTNLISLCEQKHGYLTVNLYKEGKMKTCYVHRIVAEAFMPNWFGEPHINHRDENPKNNNVDNLEWCDCVYNNNYGTRIEKTSIKMKNGKLSKPVIQFKKSGEFVREWPSASEAGRNGFMKCNVSACCKGKLKTYKGFVWRYKEVS